MANTDTLTFKPLTPDLMDDLKIVLRGSWGSSCWCMFPRVSGAQWNKLPGEGSGANRRRIAMENLARRPIAPGLLAYRGEQPVGWAAIAPREELTRVERSRATPRVDQEEVWVIPCVTVHTEARGQGVAVALVRAAAQYAFENGAPAVEAYPRAGAQRTGDDNIFFGTEPIFERAGFQVVRGPIPTRPRNWLPRLAMRKTPSQHTASGQYNSSG